MLFPSTMAVECQLLLLAIVSKCQLLGSQPDSQVYIPTSLPIYLFSYTASISWSDRDLINTRDTK